MTQLEIGVPIILKFGMFCWLFDISKIWFFKTLKLWNFEMLKLWNSETLKHWNFEILELWKFWNIWIFVANWPHSHIGTSDVGGCSTGKSFRFVRAWTRCPLPSGNEPQTWCSMFSLFPLEVFPFPFVLGRLSLFPWDPPPPPPTPPPPFFVFFCTR